jgi:hypothetical protein
MIVHVHAAYELPTSFPSSQPTQLVDSVENTLAELLQVPLRL